MALRQPYFTGLREVTANLNREIAAIERRSKAGLAEAALFVRRDAQKRTPVDTGNLKGSAYTGPVPGTSGRVREIGYEATYAPYVHERMELRHRVGTCKFLEWAMKNNVREILDIIRRRAVGKSV